MKKSLKNIVVISILIIGMLLTLTGCKTTSSKSYSFDVETGDRIKLKLDTSEGYDLSSDLPFKISKDDETLSQGIFITEESYNKYMSSVKSQSGVEILDEGSNKEIKYLFYSYNDKEYNYIIKVNDSKTGILLGNNKSEKSAKECFNRLTITLE